MILNTRILSAYFAWLRIRIRPSEKKRPGSRPWETMIQMLGSCVQTLQSGGSGSNLQRDQTRIQPSNRDRVLVRYVIWLDISFNILVFHIPSIRSSTRTRHSVAGYPAHFISGTVDVRQSWYPAHPYFFTVVHQNTGEKGSTKPLHILHSLVNNQTVNTTLH